MLSGASVVRLMQPPCVKACSMHAVYCGGGNTIYYGSTIATSNVRGCLCMQCHSPSWGCSVTLMNHKTGCSCRPAGHKRLGTECSWCFTVKVRQHKWACPIIKRRLCVKFTYSHYICFYVFTTVTSIAVQPMTTALPATALHQGAGCLCFLPLWLGVMLLSTCKAKVHQFVPA
jgi:hypothetical protein